MKCLQCGECCHAKTISLTEEDVRRISKVTDLNFYRIRNTGAKVLNWKPYKDFYVCIFFNTENKECQIYQNRPFICQKFYCQKAL